MGKGPAKGRKDTMCLNCDYTWHSRIPPEENPYILNVQCPKCYAYAATSIKQYKTDLEQLNKTTTPKQAEKSLELFDFAMKKGYMRVKSGAMIRYKRLLKDLSESSLGDDE